jgi:hypothetical protein
MELISGSTVALVVASTTTTHSSLPLIILCYVFLFDRRLAAVYGSIAAGIQCVLYADYNLPTDDKHVFTDLQLAYRNWLCRASNGVFYGDNKHNNHPSIAGPAAESQADAFSANLQQQGRPSTSTTPPPPES